MPADTSPAPARQPITAVSFKMYFDRQRTLDYANRLLEITRATPSLRDDVQLAVLPDFLTLAAMTERLVPAGFTVGAQDLAPAARGAFTGEVAGQDIHALGARVVEVGHAERRTLFGEDDIMVARKIAAAADAGLTPLLCIGEPDRSSPASAAATCVAQVRSAVGIATPSTMWLAYEPYWAIGAPQPAEPDYVSAVCEAIVQQLGQNAGTSLLYGGSAGPGLIGQLSPVIDGLFLGRFAHDPEAFVSVAKETRARRP